MRTVTVSCLMMLITGSPIWAQEHNPALKAAADASSDVVVAEVLSTNPRRAMEGARDTARLRVIRTLKGPLEPGEEIGVYHHLLWRDAEGLVLERPKLEVGSRYTLFLKGSSAVSPPPLIERAAANDAQQATKHYVLTDQWLAVLPEHLRLETDVARSLNRVDHLFGDSWRRQHSGAVGSSLRIDIIPEATVSLTEDGLILPVRIINHSDNEIRMRLAHEWHGGEVPPTDLYASVSNVQAEQPRDLHPVYLRGEKRGPVAETHIAPRTSVKVDLRMDWHGTGSVQMTPLMRASQSEYHVRFAIVFDAGRNTREYAAGTLTYVRITRD